MTWTLEKTETLLKALITVTKKKLRHFKTDPIPFSTWLKVEKVTGFSAALMKSFWDRKLYAQLYSARPIYVNQIRMHLVKRLYKSRIVFWQEIDWEVIAKDFDGINSLFLWSLMNRVLKRFFPDYRKRNVTEMMKFLKEDYIKKLQNKRKDYQLQRIWLTSSGKLVIKEKHGWCASQSDEIE